MSSSSPHGHPSPGASSTSPLPKSRSERRQFFHDSEDDSGKLLIEQYIYRHDRYRSSSMTLPFPLPMTLEDAPQSVRDQANEDTSLRPAIDDMLKRHEVEAQAVELCTQYKIGYPNRSDIGVPVLHISVDTMEENHLDRWSAARRDITAILDDHGFGNVEVEIQDPNRFYQPSIFPIHPNDPAVALFHTARMEMMRHILDRIGASWQMFSLFQVGRDAGSKKATVVLMVDPWAEHDWKSLVASLEAIIHKHQVGSGSEPSVEVMPGLQG
ncbi:MAG: hypothetical protein Q9218_004226 [Villophora microphyllina]